MSLKDYEPTTTKKMRTMMPDELNLTKAVMAIRDEADALGATPEFYSMLARCYDNLDDDNDYDLDIG